VYKIAQAMYENKPKLAESFRAFGGWDPQTMNKDMPASFHPGSLKFFKEKGLGASRSIRWLKNSSGTARLSGGLTPDAVRAAGAARRLRHGLGARLARPSDSTSTPSSCCSRSSASPLRSAF